MRSDEPFTFLGIVFSVNLNEIPELNYTKNINDIQKFIAQNYLIYL